MESRNEQLISVMRSIFRASELVRFVRANFGTRFGGLTFKKAPESMQIRGIVEDLIEYKLVDDKLFDLLIDLDQKQAGTINSVRAQFVPQAEETAPDDVAPAPRSIAASVEAPAELSDERRAWRKRMAFSLQQYAVVEPEKPAEWIEAVAVHPDFDPTKVRPFLRDGDKANAGSVVQLAAYCHQRSDGRWELQLKERREALAALWERGEIVAALESNAHERSVHTDLLALLVDQHPLPFRAIGAYPNLLAAVDIADWFAGVNVDLFNVNRVHAAIERYERVAPLRKLVGTHFRGRGEELAALHNHAVNGTEGESILTLWGTGGAGKSTILGKFLLDFDRETEPSRPWAYLDFDDPAVDPTDAAGLIELIARHIGLLYAGIDVGDEAMGLEEIFIAVESQASGDPQLASEFNFDAAGTTETGDLVSRLAAAIHELPMEPSLLLVFDTFEQVQVRGEHAVTETRKLLDMIVAEMPFARVIVSGRGDVLQWADRQKYMIGDLDAESADKVLLALGVEQAQARETIVSRVGTNPLTLRLVADAVQTGKLSTDDLESLVVGAKSLELQGHLYIRILGHIPDGEVRRLAHPGLVMRRITAGVIADVLAQVCNIDPDRIDALLEKLPNHVALFEPDEAAPDEGIALRHRQDVRESMLKLMVEDSVWQGRLAEIHDKAIDHYGKINHPIARAEELYHRLMRNDDPGELDKLWSDDLAASLSRSWGEPFPERATLWLGARLGQLQAEAVGQLRAIDIELSVAREAKSHMDSKDFEGALALLEGITERTPASRLFALEARALSRLGRFQEAIEAAKRGLEGFPAAEYPRIAMELHQVAANSGFEMQNLDAAIQHSSEAIRFAELLDDTNSKLAMLDLQVRAEAGRNGGEKPGENAQLLESLFLNANERELRNSPSISEQIVGTLGANSRNVLRKAAVTFGNRESQTVINQDVFQLEKLLRRAEETGAAKIDLSNLATQVGLPGKDYSLVDLAGASIRYGRMGDAMAVVLDHVGSNADVRQDTLSMFNLRDGGLK